MNRTSFEQDFLQESIRLVIVRYSCLLSRSENEASRNLRIEFA